MVSLSSYDERPLQTLVLIDYLPDTAHRDDFVQGNTTVLPSIRLHAVSLIVGANFYRTHAVGPDDLGRLRATAVLKHLILMVRGQHQHHTPEVSLFNLLSWRPSCPTKLSLSHLPSRSALPRQWRSAGYSRIALDS